MTRFLAGLISASLLSFPLYILLALVLHWPSFTGALAAAPVWALGAGISIGTVCFLIETFD